MKILKEQTNTPTSISGTCVFNYYKKKYSNNLKNPKENPGDWNLVDGQLHRLYNNGQIIVFKPDGEYSIREGYGGGKINKIIDGTKGKWFCDEGSDYFIVYDNENIYSTKIGQRFVKTDSQDKIAIDIIKQKLKLNDISNQTESELNKLSTKLDKYKDAIEDATWWNSLQSIWTTVKNKVKETLNTLSTTSNSTGNSSNNTSNTSKKPKGNPLKPEDYSGIEFIYKYPNDKNYIYGVKDKDWYAKNTKNQKVFNISKDGFQYSVDELNKKFPNAFNVVKDENKLESNVQVRPKDNPFTKMNKDFDPINFTPKYQTKTDSLTTNKNVSNKQQEPTIYNIDSNKNEL
jgi:hypothetical protein